MYGRVFTETTSMCTRHFITQSLLLSVVLAGSLSGEQPRYRLLDPKGQVHIPIGIVNTVDTLKTFVEAEGNFSPGVGSYGVYFWLFYKTSNELIAPTMDGVKCERGLADGRYLIPWSRWSAGDIIVKTEICQVKCGSAEGDAFVVGSRVTLKNTGSDARDVALYVAVRPLGPAGFDVKKMTVSEEGDALLVEDHPAIVAKQKPSDAAVLSSDTIGEIALQGRMPGAKTATSAAGDCSGALRFDLTIVAGRSETLEFVCPVLPGRRAVGHEWDGVHPWAQLDLAKLNPSSGGVLQPDPGLPYYRRINVASMFSEAKAYWSQLVDRVKLDLPDGRWEEAFAVIIAHAMMEMNEGAPDVAVVNYNVFNRDGVYVANIFQKSNNIGLAAEAIDYFVEHPFNGRSFPEADNPGQVLWAMGQQWLFTRDKVWAKRVYPAARKIADMVKYYRTTEGPHWVQMDSLGFGEKLPEEDRRELEPGRCDGHHPEYTEAFDIAGLRGAAILADAAGESSEAARWKGLADSLLETYDKRFGGNLSNGYGSFSVLWPCGLYPLNAGYAHEQFETIGKQVPKNWRYFPLATAHQGLLAGNREAGYGTLAAHLAHEQMRGWYAFDEGGRSGSGGWPRLRTTWAHGADWRWAVAMPHGWAIAEIWLLIRDCLVFEDNGRLVLLAGVPSAWFTHAGGIVIEHLPTYFGKLNLVWESAAADAILTLNGPADPPNGFVLRLPESLTAKVTVQKRVIPAICGGDFVLPRGTAKAHVSLGR
jgi:hypothetical protein